MIISKFDCDYPTTLTDLSSSLKISLQEVCILEREFLTLIDYSVFISSEEHQQVYKSLIDFYDSQWNKELILNAMLEAEQSIFY